MNAALDALKQRCGFEGFHLAGQSGGSTLVTGLAGTRRDIACAVWGSGCLGKSHDADSNDPARTFVNPLGFIPSIAQNRALRFIMVTDAADRTVLGKSDVDIATAVTTMVKRNAAYNEQRRKEIALFGKSGMAAGGQARVRGKRV